MPLKLANSGNYSRSGLPGAQLQVPAGRVPSLGDLPFCRPLIAKDQEQLTVWWMSAKQFASQWLPHHKSTVGLCSPHT